MEKLDYSLLEKRLQEQLKLKTNEYQRAFHGRGGCYEGFEFLTIDFIDTILYVALFNEIVKELENDIVKIVQKYYELGEFEACVLQRRYLTKAPSEVILGHLNVQNNKEIVAIENDLKFRLNMLDNQNIGIFADMKKGREFVKSHSANKRVLNLFSYTCAFSVYAMAGGACSVVNVDMSKSALTMGRTNHHLNNLDTKKVQFMPYNILKSWSRIKKAGPYDLIIIDPPSFQKGSFAATKDYEKIIKRLPQLAAKECTVLACLNDPRLESSFIIELFKEHLESFEFVSRLEHTVGFENINDEQGLKNLIFKSIVRD